MNFYELIEKSLRLERAGKRIIRLSLGETNLPTPACALEAAQKSICDSKSSYGPAGGLPELREQIALREGCSVDEVVVGPGSKQLIYALLKISAGRSGQIIVPTPAWPAYAMMCAELQLPFRLIASSPDNGWALPEIDPAAAAAVVICNPLNPTSTVYKDEAIADLLRRCQAAGTPLLIDEAYKGLAYRPLPAHHGALRVRSFSKEFCMEGWRVGYAVVPPEAARRLTAFNQLTITCVPGFVQQAALACLRHEQELLAENRKLWKRRSEAAQRILKSLGFEFVAPQSGIYIFASHPAIGDSMAYAERALEEGIAVAPGGVFGGYPEFLRVCVNQSEERFAEAANLMSKLL